MDVASPGVLPYIPYRGTIAEVDFTRASFSCSLAFYHALNDAAKTRRGPERFCQPILIPEASDE